MNNIKQLKLIEKLQIQFQESQKKLAEQELKIKLQKLNKEKEEQVLLKNEMLDEYGIYNNIDDLKTQTQLNNTRRKKHQLKLKLAEQKKLYEQAKVEEVSAHKKLDIELEEEYKLEKDLNMKNYLMQLEKINIELNKSLKQILTLRAKRNYVQDLLKSKCDLNLELQRLQVEEDKEKKHYENLNTTKKNKELQYLVESNFHVKKKIIKEVDDYSTLIKFKEIQEKEKEKENDE